MNYTSRKFDYVLLDFGTHYPDSAVVVIDPAAGRAKMHKPHITLSAPNLVQPSRYINHKFQTSRPAMAD